MNEIVVVDTNIIISALISGNERIIRILANPEIDFISSNFSLVELFKHSPRVQAKSKLTPDDLFESFRIIINMVRFVDEDVVSLGSWVEASRLCKDVDPADMPFVALSLHFDCKLWSKDNTLKNHLTQKGFSSFFEPKEILN